jgi:hypothetical protein
MNHLILLSLLCTFFSLPTWALSTKPQDDKAAGVNNESPSEAIGQKVSFFGYGEMHYNNNEGGDDELDFHRLVIGLGYDFTDRIRLRSELEFEHGGSEIYLEYAYIDFDITDRFGLRAGSILLPIGYLNQNHEPPTFYSVERPEIYRTIIPTSWMEGGFGLYAEPIDGLTLQAYATTSLNFNDGYMGDTGFSGSSGIRGGRQKVAEAVANDFAGSARVQYTGVKGLRVGTSAFVGQTAQGDARVSKGLVSLIEADAKYTFEGIEIEGLVAAIFNPEGGDMTTAQRADGNIGATDVIGTRMFGFMVEGAYHVFHHVWKDAPFDLVAFVRYEQYDTNDQVAAGFVANPAFNRQTVTAGLSYLPVEHVAIKIDYALRDNGANTANNQWNLGLAYYF